MMEIFSVLVISLFLSFCVMLIFEFILALPKVAKELKRFNDREDAKDKK